MLSIIIPIYDFNIKKLILELKKQLTENNIDFEILCYDDGSSKFKKENQSLQNQKQIIYKELDENIGRTKIRNLLINDSKYNTILLLDCDISIKNSNFIKSYLKYINKDTVVCGGIEYERNIPEYEKNLRWKYGIKREVKKAKQRNKKPYKSFTAFNVLGPKKIFQKISFNETIIGYGHEDTLFGLQLKKEKTKIIHINNSLIHLGLDNNTDFIKKTEEGLRNLKRLINEDKLDKDVKIFNYYKLLKNIKKSNFQKIKYWAKKQLNNGSTSLFVFDLYKLCFLLTLKEDE